MFKRVTLKSIITSAFIFILAVSTVFADDTAPSFRDIGTNFWANEAINSMYQEEIIKGYPDGTFKPNKTVSREEFAVMLCQAFDLEPVLDGAQSFKDVPPSRWSFGYVEAAKDYLTGYQAGNGKARFNPSGAALREDVAVALVKVMKLEATDIDPENYLESRFYDVDTISPGLYKEVAAAVQFKIVSGNPDSTFQGDKPINRASAASLMYKSMKTAVQTNDLQSQLEVTVPEKTQTGLVTLDIKTESGNQLFINNEKINTYGKSTIAVDYTLKKEGPFTFTVKAVTPQGKNIVVTKQVQYAADGPSITLNDMESAVKSLSMKVSGTVKDLNDNYPKLTVNGKEIDVDYNGKFSKTIDLKEGKNALVFKAVNKAGKTSEITKEVLVTLNGPTIDFSALPKETTQGTFNLEGRITDPSESDFYKMKVYVNGKEASVSSYSKSFTMNVTLKEGENVFNVKATNSLGKSTETTYKLVFKAGAPVLTISNLPEKSSKSTVSYAVKVDDEYDNGLMAITLNGSVLGRQYEGYDSYYNATLKTGENTFTFKVTNSKGKETIVTKKVMFESEGPKVEITSDSKSMDDSYTLRFNVSDDNDSLSKLTVKVNGRSIAQSYGYVSTTVTLNEGSNTFNIEVTNSYSKTTTVKHTVVLEKAAPSLEISVPTESQTETLTLYGKVVSPYDTLSGYPYYTTLTMTINGSTSSYTSDGSFNKDIKLTQGSNPIKITLKSQKSGKTTSYDYNVVYNPSKPVIYADVPSETTSANFTISGSVTDENDNNCNLTINGQAVTVNGSGFWTKTITLSNGENTLQIEATNKYGLKSSTTKTITLKSPTETN